MLLKFKNGTEVTASTPTEQKVFNANGSSGWVIGFSFEANVSSSDVDALLTAENIGELTLTDTNGETSTITGYNSVTMVIIRHKEVTGAVVEVQFQKQI